MLSLMNVYRTSKKQKELKRFICISSSHILVSNNFISNKLTLVFMGGREKSLVLVSLKLIWVCSAGFDWGLSASQMIAWFGLVDGSRPAQIKLDSKQDSRLIWYHPKGPTAQQTTGPTNNKIIKDRSSPSTFFLSLTFRNPFSWKACNWISFIL
jgi:hypothetical protein